MTDDAAPSEAANHRGLPGLPPRWRLVRTSGPLWFVTHATLRRPDGAEVEWTSRRHRKRLGLLTHGGSRSDGLDRRRSGRPDPSSWWMAGLFGSGSVCFAVGSMPLFFDAVAAEVVASTFFVGSLLFTTAALVQYHETVAAPDGVADATRSARGRLWPRLAARRIDWWAAAIQLVGTVFFNVTTFAATRTDLSVDQERRLIWAPDLLGSICFLAASWLAYSEVNRGIRPRSDGSVGWRITALNLAGSIAFGAAAIGARYLRTTGDIANITLVNLGTFLGALCFLVGAVLLPVESARDSAPQ